MIYVVSHKPIKIPKMEYYIPLQVGNSDKNFPGFIRDNSGDNIASKNENYCELTALYWIWKNTDDKIKGLVHYRRFFGKKNLNIPVIYEYKKLENYLREFDLIVPTPTHYHTSVRNQILLDSTTEEVLVQLELVIKKKCPEYCLSYYAIMSDNKISQYNMIYAKKKVFDEYCQWLFSLLFDLEKIVDLEKLNSYQKRVYGFLSERLMNVWIDKNQFKVKHLDVINIENSLLQDIQYKRLEITNQLRFKFHQI